MDSIHKLKQVLKQNKLDRSVFLYSESNKVKSDYAQCKTCIHWIEGRKRCYLMNDKQVVSGSGSCNEYAEGEPIKDAATKPRNCYTPKQVGFVNRKVRCENCEHLDNKKDECGFYKELNKTEPKLFSLDIAVNPQACCTANTEKKK